jgi:adhesin transport system outer membrane protein
MARAEWEAWRADRIEAPDLVEVGIEALRIEAQGDGSALVEFVQTYRSDSYQDRVLKEMRLVLEAGGWMILEERVVEQR